MKIVTVNHDVAALVRLNDGYCPCAVHKTPDTKCICTEFLNQTEPGLCHCGRYEKVREEGD
jgi:hypothetical protein